MTKFKVGDIVTWLDSTPYSITTNQAQMRIADIRLGGECLLVQILKHTLYPHHVGDIFSVESCYFKLFKPVSLENK